MNSTEKGLLVGSIWAIIGFIIGVFSSAMSMLVGLGGQTSPPAFWGIAVLVGIFGLPLPLVLGGVPVGIQIARGKPAKRTTAVVIGVTLALVVVTHAIIWIWRPKF